MGADSANQFVIQFGRRFNKHKTSDTSVKKTLISLAFVLSSLVSAPALTLGVYDNAQTMTGKPLAYEEIFVDQTSAKGWVGTNQQSVYEFADAAGVRFAFSCFHHSFFSALIIACSAANCSGGRNCHP